MEQIIKKAAEWWADKLTHVGPQDNGDDVQSDLATYVAVITAQKHGTLQPDERERFITALSLALRKCTIPEWGFTLSVDYGPDATLYDALETAIPDRARRQAFESFWPIKTHMRVCPDRVEVACGYRAPMVTL